MCKIKDLSQMVQREISWPLIHKAFIHKQVSCFTPCINFHIHLESIALVPRVLSCNSPSVKITKQLFRLNMSPFKCGSFVMYSGSEITGWVLMLQQEGIAICHSLTCKCWLIYTSSSIEVGNVQLLLLVVRVANVIEEQ